MKAKIIRIGNSQGIRLPKSILEECDFEQQVDLQIRGRSLVIRPVRQIREGWEEAFASMASNQDDTLLDSDMGPSHWDETEWRW